MRSALSSAFLHFSDISWHVECDDLLIERYFVSPQKGNPTEEKIFVFCPVAKYSFWVYPMSEKDFLYKELTYEVLGCAYDAFKKVGAGYDEIMYHKVFHHLLLCENLSI